MPTNAPSSTVEINGFALRLIRKLNGKSPAQLAEEIGRDRTYIVKIERGHPRVSEETFQALVKALLIEDDRALRAMPHALAETA